MRNLIGKKVRLTCIASRVQVCARCIGTTEGGILAQYCQSDSTVSSNIVLLEVFSSTTETISKAQVETLAHNTLAITPFGAAVTRERNMDLDFLNEPIQARLPKRETLAVTAIAPDGFAFESSKIVIDKGGCSLTMEILDREFEIPFTVEMQTQVGKINFGSARLGEMDRVPKMYWDKLRRVG